NEAQVQVELAQLEYTYPRLRAMWNHLERIKGGIGSRGPGEMQLEIDRRLVQRRKLDLHPDLATFQARNPPPAPPPNPHPTPLPPRLPRHPPRPPPPPPHPPHPRPPPPQKPPLRHPHDPHARLEPRRLAQRHALRHRRLRPRHPPPPRRLLQGHPRGSHPR